MHLFRDFPLNPNKEIRSALLDIYGVSWRKATYVTAKVALSKPFFLKNINKYHFSLVFSLLKGLVISDVRIKRRVESNIAIMMANSSYVGVRHKYSLSVRGQRTRTNANTQRNKRKRSKFIK